MYVEKWYSSDDRQESWSQPSLLARNLRVCETPALQPGTSQIMSTQIRNGPRGTESADCEFDSIPHVTARTSTVGGEEEGANIPEILSLFLRYLCTYVPHGAL